MSYTKYKWKNLYEEFLTTNLSPGAFAKEKGLSVPKIGKRIIVKNKCLMITVT